MEALRAGGARTAWSCRRVPAVRQPCEGANEQELGNCRRRSSHCTSRGAACPHHPRHAHHRPRGVTPSPAGGWAGRRARFTRMFRHGR
eukprot:scaffold1068_cov375-Prasinococcus_capsulatus_cf.AAC.1